MKIEEVILFTIIRLETNSLDLANVPRIPGILEDLCSSECRINQDIVLDLQDINNMDSSGIGLLVHFHQIISKYGCKMYFINSNETLDKILAISKLDTFFEMFKNYNEISNMYKKIL